jgi:superfamily II DNA or RNA helicase
MEPTTKKLRPYQVRLVTDVSRATEDILVEQPTGSGKTVQIVTLVAMHLGQRFTHALISAPQEQIEQGFVKRDYQAITFPDHQGVAVPSIQVPKALIKGARESRLGSVKRVIHYLRQAGPLDYAFACTHAALNRLAPKDLPADLSGKALFIDEAHHASADCLSQIVTLWRERGGQLFFFTATPYRGDGRPVRLEGMRAFRRSLAEHMAEGFAPRHLESEIVALGQPGDAITAGQFTGEEAPPSSYFDGLIAAICRRWVEGDKPKAIVRVPPMQGGKSAELVARLLQALTPHGARVLDATGTAASDKARFLAALEAEKNRTHATSAFDVMVGIQRVLEGTDWPVCSAVYCVGMPGSLNTVVQFLGRAMRLKGEDCPAVQRDRARLVFFVPCGGGAALADLSLDHSRHALLTCCFLADHEVGQEWIVLREVRRGIEAALGTRTENPAAADAENEADEALDPEIRAEVELVMADAREQIIRRGGEATVGEVTELAAKTRPDLPATAFQRVAAEILAAQPTASGTAVREAIQQEIARRLRIDPMVKRAMAEAFAVVLEEFRDVTLSDSAVLECVGRQVHSVTGRQMREFAQRLQDVLPKPLTEEQILVWADSHQEAANEWPKVMSGAVLEAPEENWANLNQALQGGNRGLPGNSSLAKLLEKHRGVRNVNVPPRLTVQQILSWADAYLTRTSDWPTVNTGAIEEACDETWRGIDQALRPGGRGLPGGSSLARLLSEARSVRHHLEAAALTIESILEWANAEYERSGTWPTKSTGSVIGVPNETWAKVDSALIGGGRGLPGGSSLAKLLAEKRGVRNRKGLPSLTHEIILAWADAHYKRTGEWPERDSGPIENAPGETWANVNAALHAGFRGLFGGSSLARLLGENRGVRNRQQLLALSETQILAWADAHHKRTGKWPRVLDGPIKDAPGETWSGVENALRAGLRGLPGSSSLAALLAENRGKRHQKNAPSLTVDEILAWADEHYTRTGSWPKNNTGSVLVASRETWSAINAALNMGTRSLPGGSSLAKVLAEHRGVRNKSDLPSLSIRQILVWIDKHHERTGQWPGQNSGDVEDSPGEKWGNIQQALLKGLRGLPGGSSLAGLTKEQLSHRPA